MILKYSTFFILFIALNAFTFNDVKTEQKREKKLNKSIHNMWDKTVKLVPHSISLNDHGFNKFEAIMLQQDTVGIVYSGRIFSCRSGGCQMGHSNSQNSAGTESEYFDAFIIFDTSLSVRKVEVYNYKATHGQEVTAKAWLKQFIDYTGGPLRYGKEIDALSGATISAENLTNEVVRVVKKIKNL